MRKIGMVVCVVLALAGCAPEATPDQTPDLYCDEMCAEQYGQPGRMCRLASGNTDCLCGVTHCPNPAPEG